MKAALHLITMMIIRLPYSELDEGCLEGFEIELEGDMPFRQFINLIDNDGEDSFIPMKQIIIMELDRNLVFLNNGDETENDIDTEAGTS